MKTTNKRLIGLLVLSVIQIVFPLLFIAAKEKVISEGKEYLFKIQPVDPYDFFQGRYVDLNIELLSFDSKNLSAFKQNDIVYLEFSQDSLGAKIKRVSKEKTLNSLKLKMYADPLKYKKIIFRLPFKRFYLEEYKAKDVEAKLARTNSKNNFVHVKILNGEYVITDISSDGKSLVTGNLL
jgi:uncharacterized membrane-anchored protein